MSINRNIKSPGIIAFLFVVTLFLICAIEAGAAGRYVKPSAEVVLRTGASREYKVIGMVKSGDAVELLEEGDAYSKVRTAKGKEGYMLTRFLSVNPPLTSVVASLRAENETLKQKENEMLQKLELVAETLKKTEMDLSSALSERDQITTDYQTLQRDTADVMKIKEDMEKATLENKSLIDEIMVLKEENISLKKDKSFNWFMAGAGVLLMGMFLGRILSKSRKRKSSLM